MGKQNPYILKDGPEKFEIGRWTKKYVLTLRELVRE